MNIESFLKVCWDRLIYPKKHFTIYCSLPAPGYSWKTCTDIGAQLRWTQKRQSDPKYAEKEGMLTYNEESAYQVRSA